MEAINLYLLYTRRSNVYCYLKKFRNLDAISHFLCCCCSVANSSPTLCDPMHRSTPEFLSFTISWSLLKFMSFESVMLSNHVMLCCPLLHFPSIRVFFSELALCSRWPKYWSFSFSFSISPSNEYSGLIFFRIDWLDLLAVQRTVKNLLQHHNLKASILWCFSLL